jgi:D-lactate dehydrogenase (cytochrome)
LAVIPEHYSVAVVPFNSVREAVSAATRIIRKGVPVAALELMDQALMEMVNLSGVTKPRLWAETPTLFIKFSGSKVSVQDNIESVRAIAESYGGRDFEFAKDSQEQEQLWSARKESLFSILALRDEGEELRTSTRSVYVWDILLTFLFPPVVNTDVAVPLSRLADIVESSQQQARDLGIKAFIKGHVGDGNFHENIKYDKKSTEETSRAKNLVKSMVTQALEMEGTCTGEHGIGYGKKDALKSELGDDTIALMVSGSPCRTLPL